MPNAHALNDSYAQTSIDEIVISSTFLRPSIILISNVKKSKSLFIWRSFWSTQKYLFLLLCNVMNSTLSLPLQWIGSLENIVCIMVKRSILFKSYMLFSNVKVKSNPLKNVRYISIFDHPKEKCYFEILSVNFLLSKKDKSSQVVKIILYGL